MRTDRGKLSGQSTGQAKPAGTVVSDPNTDAAVLSEKMRCATIQTAPNVLLRLQREYGNRFVRRQSVPEGEEKRKGSMQAKHEDSAVQRQAEGEKEEEPLQKKSMDWYCRPT
jgi:hypothetical protein